MNNAEKGRNFYQLTAQILNDKSLNHAEKLTMTILYGLSDEDGMCIPSNEWLCDKLNINHRALQLILSKLESKNYLIREFVECENDPFKKYRNIFVNNNFKFSLRDAKNCTPEENGGILNKSLRHAKNCTPDMQKIAPIIDKKELREERKRERGSAEGDEEGVNPPASPSPSLGSSIPKRKTVPEEKKEVASRVFINKSQEEDLKKRLDGTGIQVQEVYDRLSQWKIEEDVVGGTNDYRAINNWVIAAVKKKRPPTSSNSESGNSNEELAKKITNKFKEFAEKGYISLGYNYLLFNYGHFSQEIKFSENGFREQVLNRIRKMGMPIDGL